MAAEKTTAKERKPSSRALLSTEEVAEYFGVTMTTVYRWCREGHIPCLKIGKHWRVRREEMIAFLKESEGAGHPR